MKYDCVCVVPVKVVDILDVAEQRLFILRAQGQTRLVTDTLQVVLQRERENALMLKLYGSQFDWHRSWHVRVNTPDFDRPLTL